MSCLFAELNLLQTLSHGGGEDEARVKTNGMGFPVPHGFGQADWHKAFWVPSSDTPNLQRGSAP